MRSQSWGYGCLAGPWVLSSVIYHERAIRACSAIDIPLHMVYNCEVHRKSGWNDTYARLNLDEEVQIHKLEIPNPLDTVRPRFA